MWTLNSLLVPQVAVCLLLLALTLAAHAVLCRQKLKRLPPVCRRLRSLTDSKAIQLRRLRIQANATTVGNTQHSLGSSAISAGMTLPSRPREGLTVDVWAIIFESAQDLPDELGRYARISRNASRAANSLLYRKLSLKQGMGVDRLRLLRRTLEKSQEIADQVLSVAREVYLRDTEKGVSDEELQDGLEYLTCEMDVLDLCRRVVYFESTYSPISDSSISFSVELELGAPDDDIRRLNDRLSKLSFVPNLRCLVVRFIHHDGSDISAYGEMLRSTTQLEELLFVNCALEEHPTWSERMRNSSSQISKSVEPEDSPCLPQLTKLGCIFDCKNVRTPMGILPIGWFSCPSLRLLRYHRAADFTVQEEFSELMYLFNEAIASFDCAGSLETFICAILSTRTTLVDEGSPGSAEVEGLSSEASITVSQHEGFQEGRYLDTYSNVYPRYWTSKGSPLQDAVTVTIREFISAFPNLLHGDIQYDFVDVADGSHLPEALHAFVPEGSFHTWTIRPWMGSNLTCMTKYTRALKDLSGRLLELRIFQQLDHGQSASAQDLVDIEVLTGVKVRCVGPSSLEFGYCDPRFAWRHPS